MVSSCAVQEVQLNFLDDVAVRNPSSSSISGWVQPEITSVHDMNDERCPSLNLASTPDIASPFHGIPFELRSSAKLLNIWTTYVHSTSIREPSVLKRVLHACEKGM